MKIHKAGYKIIIEFTIIMGALIALSWLSVPAGSILISVILTSVAIFLELFVIYFFRVPKRIPPVDSDGSVYAPADGEIVVIEKVYEDEYLKDEVIQVSIFMSLWNVHANFYPVSGTIEYTKHHKGGFLVAWHPKSSTENERVTVAVRTGGGDTVLFRQIAGFIARRIVTYAKCGKTAKCGKQCGFIKFGSRVDIFLPLGSKINVEMGDLTVATKTKIAQLPQKCS